MPLSTRSIERMQRPWSSLSEKVRIASPSSGPYVQGQLFATRRHRETAVKPTQQNKWNCQIPERNKSGVHALGISDRTCARRHTKKAIKKIIPFPVIPGVLPASSWRPPPGAIFEMHAAYSPFLKGVRLAEFFAVTFALNFLSDPNRSGGTLPTNSSRIPR